MCDDDTDPLVQILHTIQQLQVQTQNHRNHILKFQIQIIFKMLTDFPGNRIFSGKLLLQKFLQGCHLLAIRLLPVAKLQCILHTIRNTCRNGDQVIVHILEAIAQRQHIEDIRNNPLNILISR